MRGCREGRNGRFLKVSKWQASRVKDTLIQRGKRLMSRKGVSVPRTVTALLISGWFLTSCKRLSETYDLSGRYEACEHRLTSSHMEEDVAAAARRRDFRLIGGYSYGDPVPGLRVALSQPCMARSAKVVRSELPVRLQSDEGIHSETRASLCREALDRYSFEYNREMIRIHPIAYSLACAQR